MSERISQADIDEMIRHWLHTPTGDYLGSDYGFDKHALLFQPLTTAKADEMLAKLRRDVPILSMLDQNAVNFYAIPIPPDKLAIFLQVGDSTFEIV